MINIDDINNTQNCCMLIGAPKEKVPAEGGTMKRGPEEPVGHAAKRPHRRRDTIEDTVQQAHDVLPDLPLPGRTRRGQKNLQKMHLKYFVEKLLIL